MVKPLADSGDSLDKRAFDAVSDGLIGLRRIMSNLYPPEFDDDNATFSGSYGVEGMKARAQLLKGSLEWVAAL